MAKPITTATTTAQTKSTATAPADSSAVAAVADRSSTSAAPSLSRLSPSSTVTSRDETPARLTMLVATASVGLRMAPRAIPVARSMSGISRLITYPMTTAEPITSSTENAEMVRRSRRKSIVGMLTAAE